MEKCNNCQNPSACFPDDCKVMPIYKPTPASTVLTKVDFDKLITENLDTFECPSCGASKPLSAKTANGECRSCRGKHGNVF